MIELDFKPDKTSSKPIYIQISDYIAERIKTGDWTAGTYIPTQRELARQLGVNRSTVVTALDELKAMGLIESSGKGGTRVADCLMPVYTKQQADWQTYIQDGIHISNYETIQRINQVEFNHQDIIRLSTGEASPELFPTARMAEVLRQISTGMKNLGYEEPKGMPYLREQICSYLKSYGIHTAPSCILIVSGALQAIQLISLGLLQPGASIFLEKPSYLYSLNIFQSIGMRRCGISMDEEGIQSRLISQLKPKHRQSMLYTIPNYQNPTGIVMSEGRRRELLSVCSEEKIPVIEDDVYRELWLDSPPPLPIKSLDDRGNVLYVGSVSKTLSPGLRIGWIAGPEPVIERLGDIKMQTDYGSSSLAQLTVGKWMETGYYQEHNESLRRHLSERRQTALEAMEKYFGDIAQWNVPAGGYYVWMELLYPVRMHRLFEEAWQHGILLYPGYLYDTSMNQCLRISYSYASLPEIRKGLEILSTVARKLMKENA